MLEEICITIHNRSCEIITLKLEIHEKLWNLDAYKLRIIIILTLFLIETSLPLGPFQHFLNSELYKLACLERPSWAQSYGKLPAMESSLIDGPCHHGCTLRKRARTRLIVHTVRYGLSCYLWITCIIWSGTYRLYHSHVIMVSWG